MLWARFDDRLYNALFILGSWICTQVLARSLVLIWVAISSEDILILMNSLQKLSSVYLPAFSMSLIHKYQCYCCFIGNVGLWEGGNNRLYNNYLYCSFVNGSRSLFLIFFTFQVRNLWLAWGKKQGMSELVNTGCWVQPKHWYFSCLHKGFWSLDGSAQVDKANYRSSLG